MQIINQLISLYTFARLCICGSKT